MSRGVCRVAATPYPTYKNQVNSPRKRSATGQKKGTLRSLFHSLFLIR